MSKGRVSILVVLFVLIIGNILMVQRFLATPKWSNMTEAEVNEQVTRWFYEESIACQEAGGSWIVGMTQANCTVPYKSFYRDWFVTPIENPRYQFDNFFGMFLLGVSILFSFTLLFGVLDLTWPKRISSG